MRRAQPAIDDTAQSDVRDTQEIDRDRTQQPKIETKFYRQPEKARICAALKAGASILVIGDSGTGKSTLLKECVQSLRGEGYAVADVRPSTPKQMMESIANQLGVSTVSIEGKKFLMSQLQEEITNYLRSETAFLFLDNGQRYEGNFREWLKELAVEHEQSIAVFATEVVKSDLFLALPPPLILKPLPDHFIRDLMEREAVKWGLQLKQRDFAALIPKAAGNAGGAIALVRGEYIGVDNEGAPSERGRDLTPLLLIVALVFVVSRFIGLGTGNPMLYVMAGSVGSIFLTFYRLITRIPRDGRKIKA